jgi:hypothetical protein
MEDRGARRTAVLTHPPASGQPGERTMPGVSVKARVMQLVVVAGRLQAHQNPGR